MCDDSAMVRKMYSKCLDNIGCSYHLCQDGLEAVEWLRLNYANCAAVITDMEMPRMSGSALIAFVNSVAPATPCYVVSGNHISAAELPPGARSSILKPIKADKVHELITEISLLQRTPASLTPDMKR